MKIEIKKLNVNAAFRWGSEHAVGIDFKATSLSYLDDDTISYGLGVAIQMPAGYFGMLVARSSVISRGLMLANGVGIIDPDYRGELKAVFRVADKEKSRYVLGEYVCQLILIPASPVRIISDTVQLSPTVRSVNGFGSSDNPDNPIIN